MAQMDAEQQAQLQAEVQRELERREWAEPDDSVMAEYITVLLANGSTQERVQTEMDDLVGSDFDPRFLDWLFDKAEDITRPRRRSPSPEPAPAPSRSPVTTSHPTSSGASGGSRLLSTALGTLTQPEKRKLGGGGEDHGNKRRIPDNAPSGPRMGAEGRSLADRLGGRNSNVGPGRGGLPIRGMAGGRGPANHMPNGQMGNMNNMGNMGNNQQGFNNPQMMQPGFGGFFPPGQQEMMAQMMMMQANMAQMSQMMSKMSEEKQAAAAAPPIRPVRPARPPPPAKLPQGTKLGSHSVSSITPTTGSLGPIPAKPSSTILCRFSVGCSNARCTYSHPSPVADEQTGMVLSEEPCEEGKDCKDKECIKSHVSPAAVLGESAGPSRLLCKYQNCTNPSCAFRHEDAEGNPIPPPALTAAKAAKEAKAKKAEEIASGAGEVSDGDDGDVEVVLSSKSLMDGPLDDSKREVTCRYGERCTRPDCRFSHPKSRPPTKGSKYGFSKTTVGAIGNGMNRSKKFGVAASAEEKKLNPTAGEFKPATPAEVTTE